MKVGDTKRKRKVMEREAMDRELDDKEGKS